MNPPRGCLVYPSRGSHRLCHRSIFPSVSEGWDLRKMRGFGATSTSYRPLVFGLGPYARGLKTATWMLNVLLPVVRVKRIHLHIVAIKCHRYRVEKIELRATSFEPRLL